MKIFSHLLFMSGAIANPEIIKTDADAEISTETAACEALKAQWVDVHPVHGEDDVQSA